MLFPVGPPGGGVEELYELLLLHDNIIIQLAAIKTAILKNGLLFIKII
jgi:hypothetical protein